MATADKQATAMGGSFIVSNCEGRGGTSVGGHAL